MSTVSIGRHAYLDTPPLQEGDTVALVAPSGPPKDEQVQLAVERLEAWGLKVRLGEHLLKPHSRASYLAGPDEGRMSDIQNAWCDPEVDAVIAARGGYGAMRLLDSFDWDALRKGAQRRDGRPKLLTGSSDITALHETFIEQLGVPTLFCPMITNGVFDSERVQRDVRSWLFEPWRGRDIIGPRTEILAPGRAAGRFTGGNLALLVMALGAKHLVPPAPEGILFLEDVTEDVYRLDGFLLQMDRAGRFDDVQGVVLGSWEECGDLAKVRELMDEVFADRDVPVLWEQGFGHDPEALSVPLNVDGVLDASGETPHLTVGT